MFGFLAIGLVSLGLCRALLIGWQWQRVDGTDALLSMLVQGARSDLMTLGLLAAPIVVIMPLFLAVQRMNWWIRIACAWLTFSLTVILFLELATPPFLTEYDMRPNRLFVEYLAYPREVSAMLWGGYRGSLALIAVCLATAGWLILRHFKRYVGTATAWRAGVVTMAWPIVVLLLFVMIRSSFQHRPANLATFAFCDDAMVNSLVANSTYTVLSAVYGLKNESSVEMYGDMPVAEMIARVRGEIGAPLDSFTSDEYPTLRKQVASVRRERPMNLVIVLEESLGAGFVQSLGGLPITPTLSDLADEGIWFEQLYATGTRSVRGIEAVIAGFPPTPALSVVKLDKSQRDFATLASVLDRAGYRNEFIYGGESHFDGMRSFFLGNGFHAIVDRADFVAPKFVGSWGASDEDLFHKTQERITALHQKGQPFFVLAFTSSNHSPFEFPDGRIELHEQPKQTVHNAIKYADHALGEFLEVARASPYWQDTLVMIVADHDTRVYGDELVPVSKFHIPGVILGADTQPRRIVATVSQIDLAPTLLSLMGVDSEHPFSGRDLTRTLAEFGNPSPLPAPRAMMQFDQNFAWLQNDRVTVLLPNGDVRYFDYDHVARSLHPAAKANSEMARTALANVLMPSWLYRDRLYRLRQ
ncbi:MAG TPA: LTA synthase family protein [Steroidobacteraceae bacterium]|nr:LTA synthase family protein [Steroidobacteraceae bacterium]